MRVLIVEDETVIRSGLVKHVFWKSLGVDEIKTAANAADALCICRNYSPDIVISDIFMPGENGIELCRKLRESFPDIEIIFVTGYDDKEYLKAAINLHAVRYVEKPVNRENISDAVKEAVQRHQKTREQKAASLHSLFYDSSSLPFYTNGNQVFCAGILHFGQMDKAAGVKGGLEESLAHWLEENHMSILAEISDSVTISFLLSGKDKFPLENSIKEEVLCAMEQLLSKDDKWFLSLGSLAEKAENITDSWQSAFNVGKALSYMGWNHIAFPKNVEGGHRFEPDGTIIERFAEAIFQKDEEAALEILDGFLQELLEKRVFFNGDIRYIYSAMNFALKRAKQAMCLNDKGGVEDLDMDFFESAETFAEANQYLKERLSSLFDGGESQKSTYLVKKAMDYIWLNYGDSSLSIKTLADHVYLTPTYLSNLFKKNTGLTIGQYLVDVRIENAKRLMKDPQLKFYQVASMVGYEDSNYFAKIFKKKTGMTLSEYKESLSLR